jgi:hypothetical protein
MTEDEVKFMEGLLAKPKFRDGFQKLVKDELPDYPLPEYDAKKQVREEFQAAFDKQQKELEELKNLVNTQSRDQTWKEQQDQIKKSLGWDDAKLQQFQKDFAEEFKDKGSMDMLDMAEYYELKNRPLAPAQNPRLGPFGLRSEQSSTEAKWREDARDPKSPMFSKNKRERKAYWRNQWSEAKKEMVERGIR